DLKERKAAFTIPGTRDNEPEFNGLFAIRRTAVNGEQDTVDLLLLRTGDEVLGGYSNGKINGFIQGRVVDGAFHFTWREGNASGRGVAQSQGEALRGSWGTGEADQGGGEFSGARQKKGKTSP